MAHREGRKQTDAKIAVFQITACDESMRLVCLPCSFREAVQLEQALGNGCGEIRHIAFLGRFDRIDGSAGIAEFMKTLALTQPEMGPGGDAQRLAKGCCRTQGSIP